MEDSLSENKQICNDQNLSANGELIEGTDYYINEYGFWVFTAHYLTKRGYCCKNGCKHCPYGFHERKMGV